MRAKDTAGATPECPVLLPVAENILATHTDQFTLQPDTAHRIMTGAPIPAKAIVPVEDTVGGLQLMTILWNAKHGQHIRTAGKDVALGSAVLRAGQLVTSAVPDLIAALGTAELNGIPRQRVLVISTGSELVSPSTSHYSRCRSRNLTQSCWLEPFATLARPWSPPPPSAMTSRSSARFWIVTPALKTTSI